LNWRGWLELRRLAIAPDAPKNTATRMMGFMARDIRKRHPEINRLISYQDTEVHKGTIYKAAGWSEGNRSTVSGKGWCTPGHSTFMQTTADKIRWEKAIS
jgi:hypothetical protein